MDIFIKLDDILILILVALDYKNVLFRKQQYVFSYIFAKGYNHHFH